MSRIELDRISMEDYFPSNQDTFTIAVYLTHGESVKFKLKFKTIEERDEFLNGLSINKTGDGEPTFSQEVGTKKVVLKSKALNGEYARLQIDSNSFVLYMALKKQYERQMRRKLSNVLESYEDYDFQTTYIFK